MRLPARSVPPVLAATRATWATLLAAGLLAACSPTYNWREVRPDDSGAQLMLPCRPDTHARSMPLAGPPVTLTLLVCDAGDVTWALAYADLGDPARVGAALQALQDTARANVDGGTPRHLPLAVSGATPHPASTRVAFDGRRPDGRAVQEQVAVFTKGTRVYQATVVGPQLPADAVATFFDSLRTPA